jgi:hypothetical protein
VTSEGEGYGERVDLAAAELDRLIRRLRSLTTNAWRPREAAVRDALVQLVELDRAAERCEQRALPDLPVHALADAVAVVGGDALEALGRRPDGDLLDRMLSLLRSVRESTS